MFLPFGNGASITDSSAVNSQQVDSTGARFYPRKLNSNHLGHYKKKKEFAYTEIEAPLSPLDRFISWFWSLFQTNSQNALNSPFLSWLLRILASLFLLYVVYRIFGMDKMGLFQGKNPQYKGESISLEENSLQTDYDSLLLKACSEENYGEAIRIWYYKILLDLNDQGQIEWRKGKSNQNYLLEMKGKSTYTTFQTLTYFFEYSFYGGFVVSRDQFLEVQKMFQSFIGGNIDP